MDTLRIAVAVDDYRIDEKDAIFDRRGNLVLPGGGYMRPYSGRVFVEASLPVRAFGDNFAVLPVDRFEEAVEDLVEDASAFCKFSRGATDPSKIRVRRMDLARDFDDVAHIDLLLPALLYAPRRVSCKASLTVGRSGQAESLRVGPRRNWHATLYDKSAESASRLVEGRLRFEARLRDERLKSVWAREHGGHIGVIADVDCEKVVELARGTFDLVGFGTKVVGLRESIASVADAPDLSPGERARLLGWNVAHTFGHDLALDGKTKTKYRRLQAECGIVSPNGAAGVGLRLDWEGATEVAA